MDIHSKEAAQLSGVEVRCLYSMYLAEMQHLHDFPAMTEAAYRALVMSRGENMQAVTLEHDGETRAILLYRLGDGYLDIPVFGYYYSDIKYLSMLFDKLLSDKVHSTTYINFSGYVHDDALYRYLTLTQFGVYMEYCVRKPDEIKNISTKYPVRALGKSEMNERWDEVWGLVKLILNHLKASPVFYLEDEFTEEGYREFFNDEGVTVWAASDENGRLVGLIESNNEEEHFALNGHTAYNVGEAVVLPQYRGTGLAEALLNACEKDLAAKGIEYTWVNHGTANPNAMGFWDKYFKPYRYDFERKIEFPEQGEVK